MAVVYCIIFMFDAAGVRRSVGKQAEILNKMLADIEGGGEIGETRVKELLGHTPKEVLVGAFIGIFMALLFCR